MSIPTRGIEDYLLTQGVLGIAVLLLGVVVFLLAKEIKKSHADQLTDAKLALEKYATSQERGAQVQEKMANVIEERNRTTQSLADSLTQFASSFGHSTEINKLFLQQALEKLTSVALAQDTEMKVVTALSESVRALNQRDQRGVLGKSES